MFMRKNIWSLAYSYQFKSGTNLNHLQYGNGEENVASLPGWPLGSLYKQCNDMGNAYDILISFEKPKMRIGLF